GFRSVLRAHEGDAHRTAEAKTAVCSAQRRLDGVVDERAHDARGVEAVARRAPDQATRPRRVRHGRDEWVGADGGDPEDGARDEERACKIDGLDAAAKADDAAYPRFDEVDGGAARVGTVVARDQAKRWDLRRRGSARHAGRKLSEVAARELGGVGVRNA